MRKLVFATAALSVMAFGSAHANFMSVGVVESINSAANTVKLKAGDTFVLPADYDTSSVSVGDKVGVSWQSQATSSYDDSRERNEMPTRVLQADSLSLAQ